MVFSLSKGRDLIWNYVSILIMALGGLAFSVVIAFFYNVEILGVFNRTYSYYIVLSQLSTCGLHMSVLKYVSDFRERKIEADRILIAALIVVCVVSVAVVGCSALLVGSFAVAETRRLALMNILPALFFFSINKVLLNYLNANVRMIPYAIFQGARNILICAAIFMLALMKSDGGVLTFSFVLGEFFLFLFLAVYILLTQHVMFQMPKIDDFSKVFCFGIKILPSNVVLELNTKVDVICLGWILNDEAAIGVYSFVSLFSEGFYQIYMVLRRLINPYLFEWSSNLEKWKMNYRKIKNMCVFTAIPLCASVFLVYFLIVLMLGKKVYMNGFTPLIILISSVALNGLYIAYGNVMSQLGFPGRESLANLVTVACNFILNLVFITYFGILGAAIATGISYLCFSLFILVFIRKKILWIK